MIYDNPYIFSAEGWGSFELIIDSTRRNFFQADIADCLLFKIKGFAKTELECKPFSLFEWQKIQYSYLVDAGTHLHPPFELRINNRTINTSKLRGQSHFLAGVFSFEDQVGETKIEIRDSANQQVFELNTEVYPQKMDYKSDYKAMIADISEIIQNLAFDSLKDTFKRGRTRLTGQSTYSEWWGILDALFDQLIINLGVIKRQPQHIIKNIEEIRPIDKIRNVSKRSNEWFVKNVKYSNNKALGIPLTECISFTHALSSKKIISYDTYENRFIAWAVRNIIEQLRKYRSHIDLNTGKKNFENFNKQIKTYQSQLQGILHENPFNEVSKFENRWHFSASLTRGAGYRDFLYLYLLLSKGLELSENEIFKIEPKNISTLYEYWCFLKLVQILKEQNGSNVVFQNLIKVESNKYSVQLRKGNESQVVFKKANTNETTTVYFNRQFQKDDKKIFTYNQIPDYSIKFTKKGYEQPFWYLFDAKYRFDEIPDTKNNKFDVPQDAIGQLHRYRDAILHTKPVSTTYRSAIKNLGGIILYPYPLSEKAFVENVFYKSIPQVNIGALPFLPSKTQLVTELLNTLINKRLPEEHYEQLIGMDNAEYHTKLNNWMQWVTIGVVPKTNQKERLEFINKQKLFYFPYVQNLNSRLYLSKKILICKADTNEAILCDVKSWEVLTENELSKLGTTWPHRKHKYIVFHIEKGTPIKTPSSVTPRNFRYATLEGLNRYLTDELNEKQSFYLTNPSAARLYQTLKSKGIEFQLNWVDQENDPSLVVFKVAKYRIFSSELYGALEFKLENLTINLYELLLALNNDMR